MNKNGKMHTLVYGNPCSVHVDPIEKKPLFHVLPQSSAFSIATAGCNLHCKFCQNWQISQSAPEDVKNYDLGPDKVVAAALKSNCQSIAYTYTEPIVFYEYTFDTAQRAHEQDLLNLMITAGYINEEPLRELCPHIDAANVDLKGMTEEYYRKMCLGTLAPVLNTLQIMKDQGLWIEITNLIVPTWNDTESDIRKLCQWVVRHLGQDVPVHFSRFWPMHQLKNLPPTPVKTLSRAWEIAREEGVRYPYVGNVPGHKGNHTHCPQCQKLLIKRKGYMILENHIKDSQCEYCRTPIAGIWNKHSI
jgi:pyruvate formate lyase activating enzyme